MREPTLRLGIAGLGAAGGGSLRSIARHPRFRVTAAADVRREALARFAAEFEGETYQSIEEMCASPQVDAVYIATPHHYHGPHGIAAAEAGKHVLVEKPMALTLEDCDRMIAAADLSGVKLLVGRGSHGFDPPILKMREIVHSGELGRLGMIANWKYAPFLYGPLTPAELQPTRMGGGIFFNQAPHQIDLVRMIGGGLVKTVRARTFIFDPDRPIEGAYTAFLQFEDGAVATMAYNGYDRFDTDEFHYWLGTYGQPRSPSYGQVRRTLTNVASIEEEAALRAAAGYGGDRPRPAEADRETDGNHAHFGVTIVSCERGDLRQSPDGIFLYGDEGRREIKVPFGRGTRENVFDEFYGAVVHDRPLIRDGRWGKATIEVCLAILDSADNRREMILSHQVSTRDEIWKERAGALW